jgi:hypothetical protein
MLKNKGSSSPKDEVACIERAGALIAVAVFPDQSRPD